MGPVAVIAAIGVGIAAVGTVASISAQKKAAKAQQKQFQYQRSMDNMRSARERREAIRSARLSAGAVSQAAVTQGASESSAALGGLGSINSRLNQGLSFLDQYNTLSDQASIQAGRVSKYQNKAAIAGKAAEFGMTVYSNSSSIADTVFGKGK
jgi:hypothetical protein